MKREDGSKGTIKECKMQISKCKMKEQQYRNKNVAKPPSAV
jgi:hypothetical protein